jgi:hypothetical protein
MRPRRQLHADRVPGADDPSDEHDSHDTGLTHELAVGVAVEQGRHEPVGEPVELHARVAQAHDLHDGVVAKVQPGAGGQPEQVHPTGQHVLADVPGVHVVRGPQLVEQLGVDEVHLAEVGIRRTPAGA